jgi:hypothetical protein
MTLRSPRQSRESIELASQEACLVLNRGGGYPGCIWWRNCLLRRAKKAEGLFWGNHRLDVVEAALRVRE